MSAWAGRKVAQLVALTLGNKGTLCHLCGLEGADSADHDPPRSALVAAGVPDPDSLAYLWPSHLPCNLWRGTKPITASLKAECRARMLVARGEADTPPTLSPRFSPRNEAQEAPAPSVSP